MHYSAKPLKNKVLFSSPPIHNGWTTESKKQRRKFRIESAETMVKFGMQDVCNSHPPFC